MTGYETQPGRLFDRLRRIRDSLIALAQSRVELFVVEWQEEKLRLLSLAIWLGFGLVLGAIGLLVALGTLAVWLWEAAGYTGLALLASATMIIAIGILWNLRRQIRRGPRPFAETISEFRKDAECLRGGN